MVANPKHPLPPSLQRPLYTVPNAVEKIRVPSYSVDTNVLSKSEDKTEVPGWHYTGGRGVAFIGKNVRKINNRGPKKFSLCLNSKGLREKREDGKGKTQ